MKRWNVIDTLTVETATVADPRLVIDRDSGGLLRVELDEVRHLVAALQDAAADLAGRVVGDPDGRNGK